MIALLVPVRMLHLAMLAGGMTIWNLAISEATDKGGHLHFSKENGFLRLLFVRHFFLFIRHVQLAEHGQVTSK